LPPCVFRIHGDGRDRMHELDADRAAEHCGPRASRCRSAGRLRLWTEEEARGSRSAPRYPQCRKRSKTRSRSTLGASRRAELEDLGFREGIDVFTRITDAAVRGRDSRGAEARASQSCQAEKLDR
jgi:hypothetical protein